MTAAAAKIPIQALLNFRDARVGIFVEQDFGRHDHAIHAIAALRGLFVDKRSLERMRMGDIPQPFECHDALVLRRARRNGAGSNGLAVHDDRARTALSQASAKPRAMQSKVVAQNI